MKTNPNDFITGPTDGERLTKREYFAGLAMQGILANPTSDDLTKQWIIIVATGYADALIEELNKTNEHQPKPNDGGA